MFHRASSMLALVLPLATHLLGCTQTGASLAGARPGVFLDRPGVFPEEAAVVELVAQLEAGWNAGSGERFAAPFAPDADYVVVNGAHRRGRQAIAEDHQALFAGAYRGSRIRATLLAVRGIRPDVVVAHVRWDLELLRDGPPAGLAAYNTLVLTREEGSWRVAAFQNTPLTLSRPAP